MIYTQLVTGKQLYSKHKNILTRSRGIVGQLNLGFITQPAMLTYYGLCLFPFLTVCSRKIFPNVIESIPEKRIYLLPVGILQECVVDHMSIGA